MNIVFDLGGVVFDWRPEKIMRQVFSDAGKRARVKAGIFEHPDWIDLDRGTLSFDAAVARGAQRTGLERDEIERLLNAVPPSLTPLPETEELLRDIRDTDNRFFVLSNMHHASINYLQEQHDIWDMFDGIVVSCRINMIKPEVRIFEHLLHEYHLTAADTVFIDDMAENLRVAATTGMRTIRFTDAPNCRESLREMGCID